MKIRDIHGDMAFDSRGEPTVRVKIMLQDGTEGIGIAPSGASTGSHEARELRDGGDAYSGRGVHAAVENVNAALADVLRGAEAFDQGAIDAAMIEADDTPDKHKIGANAIIAASWAVANAAANALRMPLYRYLGGVYGREMPCPMFNVINGGRHADNNLDIQEFMYVPCGAESFHEAMRMGVECRRALGTLLPTWFLVPFILVVVLGLMALMAVAAGSPSMVPSAVELRYTGVLPEPPSASISAAKAVADRAKIMQRDSRVARNFFISKYLLFKFSGVSPGR